MIVITSTFTADVMRSQLIELFPPASQPNILFITQQIFSQLLLSNSEFQKNRSGFNVLLIRLSDLMPYTATPQSPAIEQFITEFSYTVTTAHATMQVPLLILFSPTPADLAEKTEFYTSISTRIQQRITASNTLCIIQASEILQHKPLPIIHAPLADQVGQLPYTLEFYRILSTVIFEKISTDTPIDTLYESPQNLLQNKIIAIFAEVLQIDACLIGSNTEFFDLGGTSLSALKLIQILNKQFHVSIDFSILYIHATAKLLSDQISDILSKTQFAAIITHTQMHHHSLKQIKAGQPDKLPIIFIHPVGGTGCCYLDLIKALPDDQPCYLIQDPSIDAHRLLFDDIVSMATYYNHLLLKHLSRAPFILAGYAFGGLLALEMIRQLEHKNLADCVHSLIAFDTWVEISTKPHDRQPNTVIQSDESQPWMVTYYNQLQNLNMAYTPAKISKKIVLFKASQNMGEDTSAHSLNLFTTEPLETHLIACDHDSILQWPHVRLISHHITQYLQESIHGMA
ncbi:MAG: thioesterase domain-containing protein [Gammaproteobacteria bacterium]